MEIPNEREKLYCDLASNLIDIEEMSEAEQLSIEGRKVICYVCGLMSAIESLGFVDDLYEYWKKYDIELYFPFKINE